MTDHPPAPSRRFASLFWFRDTEFSTVTERGQRPPLPFPQLHASNDLLEDGLRFVELFTLGRDTENVKEGLVIKARHQPHNFGGLCGTRPSDHDRAKRRFRPHRNLALRARNDPIAGRWIARG